MAGQGVVHQAAQAVVQAQLAGVVGAQATLLQRRQQVEAGGVGLRRPVLQQGGLLVGLGGDEEVGVAGLRAQGQQQEQGEQQGVEGLGHGGFLER